MRACARPIRSSAMPAGRTARRSGWAASTTRTMPATTSRAAPAWCCRARITTISWPAPRRARRCCARRCEARGPWDCVDPLIYFRVKASILVDIRYHVIAGAAGRRQVVAIRQAGATLLVLVLLAGHDAAIGGEFTVEIGGAEGATFG